MGRRGRSRFVSGCGWFVCGRGWFVCSRGRLVSGRDRRWEGDRGQCRTSTGLWYHRGMFRSLWAQSVGLAGLRDKIINARKHYSLVDRVTVGIHGVVVAASRHESVPVLANSDHEVARRQSLQINFDRSVVVTEFVVTTGLKHPAVGIKVVSAGWTPEF